MKLKYSKVGEFVPVTSKKGLYYGGYQNSLGDLGVSKFYRDRSCVVTAFTNTYLYMYHPREKFLLKDYNDYHYDFYKKIRPHIYGVPTAGALNRSVNRIRKDRNLNLYSHIMQEYFIRQHTTEEKIAFINEALRKNCPVIFINWVSKNVKVLAHHGVTITECNDMGDYHELVISSWGRVYKINFEIFDKQLKSYSGFIYFERYDYEIH